MPLQNQKILGPEILEALRDISIVALLQVYEKNKFKSTPDQIYIDCRRISLNQFQIFHPV